jgi:hypothetical protein
MKRQRLSLQDLRGGHFNVVYSLRQQGIFYFSIAGFRPQGENRQ